MTVVGKGEGRNLPESTGKYKIWSKNDRNRRELARNYQILLAAAQGTRQQVDLVATQVVTVRYETGSSWVDVSVLGSLTYCAR